MRPLSNITSYESYLISSNLKSNIFEQLNITPKVDNDEYFIDGVRVVNNEILDITSPLLKHCPYRVGDVFFIQEDWAEVNGNIIYKEYYNHFFNVRNSEWNDKSSMTKENSRTFIRIKEIKLVQADSISTDDIVSNGIISVVTQMVNSYIREATEYPHIGIPFKNGIWKKFPEYTSDKFLFVCSFEMLNKREYLLSDQRRQDKLNQLAKEITKGKVLNGSKIMLNDWFQWLCSVQSDRDYVSSLEEDCLVLTSTITGLRREVPIKWGSLYLYDQHDSLINVLYEFINLTD